MKNKAFSLGLSFIFLFGCATAIQHNVKYDIALEEVERPSEANEQYGEHKVLPTEERGYKYEFEDELIKILWYPSSTELGFLLKNKTDHSIQIVWNNASYICEKGESHKVIHSGVKYINRNEPQKPLVIKEKEEIMDFIFPADYVNYSTERWIERPSIGRGWEEKPLLPNSKRGGDPQEFLEDAKSYIGKTMKVLLPIKSEDVTYSYIFTFEVKDVYLATK